MMYFLIFLVALLTAATVYALYEINHLKEQKKEELIKGKRRGVVIDTDWKKEHFNHVTERIDLVYIEAVELEKVGNNFSRLGFVKVTGSLSKFQKLKIKDEMPLVIETNKLTWSTLN